MDKNGGTCGWKPHRATKRGSRDLISKWRTLTTRHHGQLCRARSYKTCRRAPG